LEGLDRLKSIILLSPDLLEDRSKLKEIDHWLRVMNRPQGWHYDMDIIWILNALEEQGVVRGSTILDAGAGMGITQFILAARGYDVISLDFSPRTFPKRSEGIFKVELGPQNRLEYKHDYMEFINYGNKSFNQENVVETRFFKRSLNALSRGTGYIYSRLHSRLAKFCNQVYNYFEKARDHSEFGKIKFIRAPFHKIPIEDETVDALVSVSAIEHADPELWMKSMLEMQRVVKKGHPLLITTSASNRGEDWFHEKTQGWCFSKKTLQKLLGNRKSISFDIQSIEKKILKSKIWRKRIDAYYSDDPKSEFYRRKLDHLPYLPVGLKIICD